MATVSPVFEDVGDLLDPVESPGKRTPVHLQMWNQMPPGLFPKEDYPQDKPVHIPGILHPVCMCPSCLAASPVLVVTEKNSSSRRCYVIPFPFDFSLNDDVPGQVRIIKPPCHNEKEGYGSCLIVYLNKPAEEWFRVIQFNITGKTFDTSVFGAPVKRNCVRVIFTCNIIPADAPESSEKQEVALYKRKEYQSYGNAEVSIVEFDERGQPVLMSVDCVIDKVTNRMNGSIPTQYALSWSGRDENAVHWNVMDCGEVDLTTFSNSPLYLHRNSLSKEEAMECWLNKYAFESGGNARTALLSLSKELNEKPSEEGLINQINGCLDFMSEPCLDFFYSYTSKNCNFAIQPKTYRLNDLGKAFFVKFLNTTTKKVEITNTLGKPIIVSASIIGDHLLPNGVSLKIEPEELVLQARKSFTFCLSMTGTIPRSEINDRVNIDGISKEYLCGVIFRTAIATNDPKKAVPFSPLILPFHCTTSTRDPSRLIFGDSVTDDVDFGTFFEEKIPFASLPFAKARKVNVVQELGQCQQCFIDLVELDDNVYIRKEIPFDPLPKALSSESNPAPSSKSLASEIVNSIELSGLGNDPHVLVPVSCIYDPTKDSLSLFFPHPPNAPFALSEALRLPSKDSFLSVPLKVKICIDVGYALCSLHDAGHSLGVFSLSDIYIVSSLFNIFDYREDAFTVPNVVLCSDNKVRNFRISRLVDMESTKQALFIAPEMCGDKSTDDLQESSIDVSRATPESDSHCFSAFILSMLSNDLGDQSIFRPLCTVLRNCMLSEPSSRTSVNRIIHMLFHLLAELQMQNERWLNKDSLHSSSKSLQSSGRDSSPGTPSPVLSSKSSSQSTLPFSSLGSVTLFSDSKQKNQSDSIPESKTGTAEQVNDHRSLVSMPPDFKPQERKSVDEVNKRRTYRFSAAYNCGVAGEIVTFHVYSSRMAQKLVLPVPSTVTLDALKKRIMSQWDEWKNIDDLFLASHVTGCRIDEDNLIKSIEQSLDSKAPIEIDCCPKDELRDVCLNLVEMKPDGTMVTTSILQAKMAGFSTVRSLYLAATENENTRIMLDEFEDVRMLNSEFSVLLPTAPLFSPGTSEYKSGVFYIAPFCDLVPMCVRLSFSGKEDILSFSITHCIMQVAEALKNAFQFASIDTSILDNPLEFFGPNDEPISNIENTPLRDTLQGAKTVVRDCPFEMSVKDWYEFRIMDNVNIPVLFYPHEGENKSCEVTVPAAGMSLGDVKRISCEKMGIENPLEEISIANSDGLVFDDETMSLKAHQAKHGFKMCLSSDLISISFDKKEHPKFISQMNPTVSTLLKTFKRQPNVLVSTHGILVSDNDTTPLKNGFTYRSEQENNIYVITSLESKVSQTRPLTVNFKGEDDGNDIQLDFKILSDCNVEQLIDYIKVFHLVPNIQDDTDLYLTASDGCILDPEVKFWGIAESFTFTLLVFH